MEVRVAALEAHMEHVRGDIGDIKTSLAAAQRDITDVKVDVGKIDTKVDALPGKGFIVTVVLTIATILAAITAFGPALRHLLGLT
jgi:hypothetical protein